MAVSASLGKVEVLDVRLGDVGALSPGDERPGRHDREIVGGLGKRDWSKATRITRS
jgi:hypothetical protein